VIPLRRLALAIAPGFVDDALDRARRRGPCRSTFPPQPPTILV